MGLSDATSRLRRPRALAIAFGSVAAAAVLSGCTVNEAFFFDIPEPASKEAHIILNLWNGSWIAVWIVGFFTWGLMVWAAIAYRRRHKDQVPEQTAYNLPLELLYTVVPLIMVLGLFWFTVRDQTELLTMENDQVQTVNVIAYRWDWGFNYLDEGVYALGTPTQNAVLVLPINEKVRFELTSPDVIHSFWVPDFLFKMDVIPGKTNAFELTPDKIGTYPGRCAELCGVSHSQMLFTVKVVERAEFDAYVEQLKAKGQTGLLDTGISTDEGQMPGEKMI